MNISAGLGVAVREFPLSTGDADYLLYVDGKACGVVEAIENKAPTGKFPEVTNRVSFCVATSNKVMASLAEEAG